HQRWARHVEHHAAVDDLRPGVRRLRHRHLGDDGHGHVRPAPPRDPRPDPVREQAGALLMTLTVKERDEHTRSTGERPTTAHRDEPPAPARRAWHRRTGGPRRPLPVTVSLYLLVAVTFAVFAVPLYWLFSSALK